MAVTSRLVSKLPSLNPAFSFGWDDWTILASMIALIPADIGSQILVDLGLGQDMWMIPPEHITWILRIFFVEELLYSFVIAVTKVSILIFYLRLFTEPWFRSCGNVAVMTFINGGVNIVIDLTLFTLPVTQL
ncbi:hypothetical protein EsH8_X_000537 [Colletotrichum jinshuiense]